MFEQNMEKGKSHFFL